MRNSRVTFEPIETMEIERESSFQWSSGESRPTDRGEYGISNQGSSPGGNSVLRLRRGYVGNGTGGSSGGSGASGGMRRQNTEENQAGKLGMIEGVYFRVLTNLFGVILFLRLGWMVGYVGIIMSIVIVLLCSLLTLITALSLSAICTNGRVAAGGAYYLISRALGPEFGASIGVLFYVATSVSVSLYLLGFAETVTNSVNHVIFAEGWDLRLIAFFALCFCQLVCLVGVSIVVKIEKFMLFILLAAVLLFVIQVFIGPSGDEWFGQVKLQSGLNMGMDTGGLSKPQPDVEELRSLLGSALPSSFTKYDQCQETSDFILQNEYGRVDVGVVLAVFFPAVTGILAGANISGDLKNPSFAIPYGTIYAIVSGSLIYVILCILFGAAFYRVTVIAVTLTNDTGKPVYDCEYGGLFHDTTLVAEASVSKGFVTFGIYAASLSSGLAALLGAPRILQALARDRLFSMFDPLAKGYGRNDEPLRAYGVTFIIASLCILTGDINSVAPLITTFFLSSYAMVNYACFSAEESKSPGWRPTFKYFDKWLAFVGAIGCISFMLFLSAITGFITFTIGLALYKYVEVSTREGGAMSNWGPHKEAAEYNTALRASLLLEEQASVLPPPSNTSGKGKKVPSSPMNESSMNRFRTENSEELNSSLTHTEIELGVHEDIANQRYPKVRDDDDDDDDDLEIRSIHGDYGDDDDDDNNNNNNNSNKKNNRNKQKNDKIRENGTFEKDEYAEHHQQIQFDTTHVKNYRPQCLVLSGPPSRRPALAVLVQGLRKARGVTIFGDVLTGELSDPDLLRTRNCRAAISYVASFRIKAFNDVIIAPSFRTGCRSLMQVSGLGRRMRVNTVVLGFLDDWRVPLSQRTRHHAYDVEPSTPNDGSGEVGVAAAADEIEDYSPPVSVVDYVGVIGDAFDLGLGVVILRGELDLLRSEHATQTIRTEMENVLTLGFGTVRDQFHSQNGKYQNPNYVGDEHAPARLQTMLSTSSHDTVDFDNDPRANVGDASAAVASASSDEKDSDTHSIDMNPPPVRNDSAASGLSNRQQLSSSYAIGRKSAKRIDVWWLVDDGGLTLMLPHILRQANSPPWKGCSLRVMAIGATDEEAANEEQAMMKLLFKLRIEAQVSVVSLKRFESMKKKRADGAHGDDGNSKNNQNYGDEYEQSRMENIALEQDDDDDERNRQDVSNLQRQLFRAYSSMDETQNKSRRETYQKVGNLIAEFSADALLVAVSLPVPPMSLDPEEYMHWLDLLSKNCEPPVLLVRGSQRDVVTSFS